MAVGPKGVTVETADEHIHKAALKKKRININLEEWLASACIACPPMRKAELELQRKFIKAKKIPPLRMHMQCRSCHTDLVPNLILQAGLGYACEDELLSPPAKGKKIKIGDREYVLDEVNVVAWYTEDGTPILVKDTMELQSVWMHALV